MRLTLAPWLKTVAIGGVFVTWALVAHLGSAGIGSAELHLVFAMLPILLTLGLGLWHLKQRAAMPTVLALSVVAFWRYGDELSRNVALLYYMQHLGSHLAMAVFFGKTLAAGQEPLITQIARRIEGDELSSIKMSYTRKVTVAWTVFFCVNASVSTALFLFAPRVVWSFHANLLTGPLLGLMFVAELMVRVWVLPPEERPSLMAVARAYHQVVKFNSNSTSDPHQ